MMGRQDRDQGQLFYEFSLDEMIPTDHLLRRIDGFANADGVQGHAGHGSLQLDRHLYWRECRLRDGSTESAGTFFK